MSCVKKMRSMEEYLQKKKKKEKRRQGATLHPNTTINVVAMFILTLQQHATASSRCIFFFFQKFPDQSDPKRLGSTQLSQWTQNGPIRADQTHGPGMLVVWVGPGSSRPVFFMDRAMPGFLMDWIGWLRTSLVRFPCVLMTAPTDARVTDTMFEGHG